MVTSRSTALLADVRVSTLADDELRIAIAREVLQLKNVHIEAGGEIVGDHATALTFHPITVPDWLDDEYELMQLEMILKNDGHGFSYRRELAVIAGDFNENPTRRQRCEAALLAVRQDNFSSI
jgi:hypothetical protein